MPHMFYFREYDDFEILGLYHTIEEAEDAKHRYISEEVPNIFSIKRDAFEEAIEIFTEEESLRYTEEEIEKYYDRLISQEKEYPEFLHISELTFGDYWTHTSHVETV